MKKNFLIFLVVLFNLHTSFAQNNFNAEEIPSQEDLVGTWQFSSSKVGAGLLENFRFFKDGKFIYYYNPTSDNNKFEVLKGTFKIDKNQLLLKIYSLTESSGGVVVTGSVGMDLDLFVIDKSIRKEKKIDPPNELDPLFISKFNIKARSMKINNKIFYRVSSNPTM